MARTSFDPKTHGFRFSNNDIKWWGGSFLCGGMIYAALDYYHCQMAIPPDTKAPPRDSKLHDYIYQRQMDAHASSGAKFGGMWLPGVSNVLEVLGLDLASEHAKACGYINRGLPVPVCLFGKFAGHHLLAIESGPPASCALTVYDPNFPQTVAVLERKPDGKVGNSADNDRWAGYFVDDGYTRHTPFLVYGQSGWRWCWKCQGLYFAEAGSGVCPASKSGHDRTGSGNYVLADGAGSGQRDWRWCCKCQGLFFSFNGRAGACPAGARHDGSRSGNYVLAIDGAVGQQNWRWCTACDGLFFAGGGMLGVCPANPRGHDGSVSGSYTLPAVGD